MTDFTDPDRVLSIQSHVVSGYVGNRAATFPLQTLGYEVDVVNSVQLSNHTGYGHTSGTRTSADDLRAIFDGLWKNGLIRYDRALSGYIPGAEALQEVGTQMARIRKRNPDLIYVLDPVMGDVGRGLYVSQEVIPVYKSMLRLATIITPNQFEVELLSGIQITSLQTLRQALRKLHDDYDIPHIVLSSIALPQGIAAQLHAPTPPDAYTDLLPRPLPPLYEAARSSGVNDDTLFCFASTRNATEIDTWAYALPTIRGYFAGVGDLFSSLVLAHYRPQDESPEGASLFANAVSKALLGVQQILLRTHLYSLSRSVEAPAGSIGSITPASPDGSDIPTDDELDSKPSSQHGEPNRKIRRMRLRELRIIEERGLLDSAGPGWSGQKLDWSQCVRSA